MKAICDYKAKVNIHIGVNLEEIGWSFEEFKETIATKLDSVLKKIIESELESREVSTSVERINCTCGMEFNNMKIGDIIPKDTPYLCEIAQWLVANNAHAEDINGKIVIVKNT